MARASRTTIRSLAAACFAAALAIPCTAASQAFPSKPIRLVTPTPPGGAPDVLARMVADKMPGLIGQPLVVENRTGANGVIGA
jgi:tripartite-type tricarboxylate transporter receptor subunit TctC